jgi:hypothetical protein
MAWREPYELAAFERSLSATDLCAPRASKSSKSDVVTIPTNVLPSITGKQPIT